MYPSYSKKKVSAFWTWLSLGMGVMSISGNAYAMDPEEYSEIKSEHEEKKVEVKASRDAIKELKKEIIAIETSTDAKYEVSCDQRCMPRRGTEAGCSESVLARIGLTADSLHTADGGSPCMAIYITDPSLSQINAECRNAVKKCGDVARILDRKTLDKKLSTLEASLKIQTKEERALRASLSKAARACPSCAYYAAYNEESDSTGVMGSLGGGFQAYAYLNGGGGGWGNGWNNGLSMNAYMMNGAYSNPYYLCMMHAIPCGSYQAPAMAYYPQQSWGYNPYANLGLGLNLNVGTPWGYNPYANNQLMGCSGWNTGMNTGYFPGMNTGWNPGFNAGLNAGFYPGMNTGWNPGFNSGFNTGYYPGFNPGFNTGFNTGMNPGFNTGFNTGMNPGFNTGFNTGMNPGFNTGFNTGMNPGFNTGFNTGMNSGFNTGFNNQGSIMQAQNNQRNLAMSRLQLDAQNMGIASQAGQQASMSSQQSMYYAQLYAQQQAMASGYYGYGWPGYYGGGGGMGFGLSAGLSIRL